MFFISIVAEALRLATAQHMLFQNLFPLLCFRAGARWVAAGPSSTARSVAAPAALMALCTPLSFFSRWVLQGTHCSRLRGPTVLERSRLLLLLVPFGWQQLSADWPLGDQLGKCTTPRSSAELGEQLLNTEFLNVHCIS